MNGQRRAKTRNSRPWGRLLLKPKKKNGVHQGFIVSRTDDREAAWGAQNLFMSDGRDAQGKRTPAGNPTP